MASLCSLERVVRRRGLLEDRLGWRVIRLDVQTLLLGLLYQMTCLGCIGRVHVEKPIRDGVVLQVRRAIQKGEHALDALLCEARLNSSDVPWWMLVASVAGRGGNPRVTKRVWNIAVRCSGHRSKNTNAEDAQSCQLYGARNTHEKEDERSRLTQG